MPEEQKPKSAFGPRATHAKVVIVGGGFGGLRAAKALRNAQVQITLIDRSNHHLFQPLLYQVATAGLATNDIATPIRHVLSKQKNVDVLMAEVTGIDVKQRRVLLGSNMPSVEFDYLVIATGATHSYFGHPEWETNAPGLKSVADASRIRDKILLAFEKAEIETNPEIRKAYLTFIMVGGGPTGVELAGSTVELAHAALASDFRRIDPRSAKVLLVEAGPRILSAFSEPLAQKAKQALEKLGVEVRTSARVEEIDEDGIWVSGERIPSKTVLWAAGVVASPAGKWLGTETDRAGRVIVKPDLSVPGHPEIFVIGDTAHVVDSKGKMLPGVAPVAMQQGSYVGGALKQRAQGRAEVPPFFYFDKGNLATVGRKFAIAELRSVKLSGFVAWLAWIVVHIFYLIGFRNRLLVLIEWAWAYVTFQRGARLIVPAASPEKTQSATPIRSVR